MRGGRHAAPAICCSTPAGEGRRAAPRLVILGVPEDDPVGRQAGMVQAGLAAHCLALTHREQGNSAIGERGQRMAAVPRPGHTPGLTAEARRRTLAAQLQLGIVALLDERDRALGHGDAGHR